MIRHCDGTDPNLVWPGDDGNSYGPDAKPCDCGLRFDDVDRLVIYPHELLGPKPLLVTNQPCPCGHGEDDICLNDLIYGSCGNEACDGACEPADTCKALPGCCQAQRAAAT